MESSQADESNGTKVAISLDADQQLDAQLDGRLTLDREEGRGEPRLHLAKRFPQRRLVGDGETYAAGVALVVATERLQDHRVTNRRGGGHRLRFRPSGSRLVKGNPRAGQQAAD